MTTAGDPPRRTRAIWLGVLAALLVVTTAGWAGASTPGTAAVRADLLRRSDLPAGWVQSPAAATPTDTSSTDKQLASCLGVPKTSVTGNSPQVNAPTFSLKQGSTAQEITSSISVGRQLAREQTVFAALERPAASGCIGRIFRSVLKKAVSSSPGTSVRGLSTSRLPIADYLGRTVGYRISLTVAVSDQSIPMDDDLVFAQRGRYTAEFSFLGIGTRVPASVENRALSAVTSQMKSLPTT